MAELQFQAPNGHSVVVKPVAKIGGPMEGKWSCKIKGPAVTGKSGVKTVYSLPNEEAAKQKIAKFLRVSPNDIVKTNNATIPAQVTPARESPKDSILAVRSQLRESSVRT